MGQSRYGRLPKSQNWFQVVSLLSSQTSDAQAIAAATARACRGALKRHAGDPVLVHCVYLLAHLPRSAREGKAAEFLRANGIKPTCLESPASLIAETAAYLYSKNHRNDDPSFVSEVAVNCFEETLAKLVSNANLNLFAGARGELETALSVSATPRAFANAARDFFVTFMGRTLMYFLSKETVNNIGPAERFETLDSIDRLSTELRQYCYESATVIYPFAEEWYSKYRWLQKLELENFGTFTWAVLRKLSAEIGREHSIV